jgi:hypothetical protein
VGNVLTFHTPKAQYIAMARDLVSHDVPESHANNYVVQYGDQLEHVDPEYVHDHPNIEDLSAEDYPDITENLHIHHSDTQKDLGQQGCYCRCPDGQTYFLIIQQVKSQFGIAHCINGQTISSRYTLSTQFQFDSSQYYSQVVCAP